MHVIFIYKVPQCFKGLNHEIIILYVIHYLLNILFLRVY